MTTAPKLSSRLAHFPRWAPLLVLGLAASLLYVEAVNFGLFNDDPTGNFAWLDGHSLFELFGSASGYGFYRPAGFAIWKVLYYLFGSHNAVALHAVSILLHGVNTVAVWLLAYRLLRRPGYAWMAAAIFACAPLSYEAVAYVAALFHPLLTLWIIAAVLFYDRGRQQGSARYLVMSFACLITALFTHENGVVLMPLLLAWELLFGKQIGRRKAIWFLAFGFAATGAFLVLWARMQDSLSGRAHPFSEILANTLPFLQAIASPVLPYVRLTVEHSAWLVFIAFSVLVLAGVAARVVGVGRAYVFALTWLIVTATPAIFFLPNEYVRGGPRLFYLTWVGVALLWSILLAAIGCILTRRTLATALQLLLLVLIVVPPVAFVRCELGLYGDATRLVRQVAQLAMKVEAQRMPVFVNLPVYFKDTPTTPQGCSYAYPWVHNGAIVFPTYVQLRDFIRDNGGPDRPAHGVSATMYDAIWPPRFGEPIDLSSVRDLVRDNVVYVFDTKTWSFFPLSETWEMNDTGSEPMQVTFGDEVGLAWADVQRRGKEIFVALRWHMLAPPRPLTVFVHVYDAEGKLVAQSDAPLGQNGARMLYAPFELRRQSDVIEDRHIMGLPGEIAQGTYTIATGIYEPVTIRRLPARIANGDTLRDNMYVLEQ